MTQYEAVSKALDEIGIATSLSTLTQRAQGYYGKSISNSCQLRTRYCEERGIDKIDCRTYDGQYRRDMFDDKQCSWEGMKLIKKMCGKLRMTGSELAKHLEMFHSIDQIRLHCRELDEFQSKAA